MLSFHAKMASTQEKAQIVVLFSELKSIVRMQGSFVTKRIKAWQRKFLETGIILKSMEEADMSLMRS
jgi:hypothetical protein